MIKVREINIRIEDNSIDKLKEKVCKRLGINLNDLKEFYIRKKSIDARRDIHFCYEVDVVLNNEDSVLKKCKDKNISRTEKKEYSFNRCGNIVIDNRPVVVGSGPSGLFASYMLAISGYRPIVIERGMDVDNRVKKVEDFFNGGELDSECNVCFGEGGAGTFSDGKLNTLVSDKENRILKVFEIFVQNGASSSILYENKPHIGTDVLRKVVKNMRCKIEEYGGSFMFNSKLTNIDIENNKVKGIIINDKDYIKTDVLILGIGHSARDTFRMLKSLGVNMKSKPFAVGVRIEHPRELIDKNQYGKYFEMLPPASYKLTYKAKNGRGVYSFCMCPGGYVVNSSSQVDGTVVNGMSYFKRDSSNSNSAIVVTVSSDDYGSDVLSGCDFQRELEVKTNLALGGKIPVQLWKDFKNGVKSTSFGSFKPCIKGKYDFYDLNMIFPEYITSSLKEAIMYFDSKIKGFAMDDAIISAVESRTSSPVTIIRDENFESNIKGLYPIGEGAGYSGGITTSGVDGIKVSEKIREKYKSLQ